MATKDEYDNHVYFFKWMVGIAGTTITIIAGAAIFFTYNNLNDLRNETKVTLEKIEERTDKSWAIYQNSLEHYNTYAENTLNRTQSFANEQILHINEESKKLALNAANNRISEAFKEPKIAEMIQNTGESLIAEFIDNQLQNSLRNANAIITNQMKLVPDLILSTDLIRTHSRKAYEHLDSLSKNTPDSLIKSLAKHIINEEKKIYQESVDLHFKQFFADTTDKNYNVYSLVNSTIAEGNPKNEKDSAKILNNLIQNMSGRYPIDEMNTKLYFLLAIHKCIKNSTAFLDTHKYIINSNQDLYVIAMAFKMLQIHKYDLKMFDYERIKELKPMTEYSPDIRFAIYQ